MTPTPAKSPTSGSWNASSRSLKDETTMMSSGSTVQTKKKIRNRVESTRSAVRNGERYWTISRDAIA